MAVNPIGTELKGSHLKTKTKINKIKAFGNKFLFGKFGDINTSLELFKSMLGF